MASGRTVYRAEEELRWQWGGRVLTPTALVESGPSRLGWPAAPQRTQGRLQGAGALPAAGGGPASPTGVCPGVMSQSILSLDRPMQSIHSPARALRSWTQWNLSNRAHYKENAGLLQRGISRCDSIGFIRPEEAPGVGPNKASSQLRAPSSSTGMHTGLA